MLHIMLASILGYYTYPLVQAPIPRQLFLHTGILYYLEQHLTVNGPASAQHDDWMAGCSMGNTYLVKLQHMQHYTTH